MTIHRQQVVVAYSLSTGGTEVLEQAIELACRYPGRVLHVLHAVDAHLGTPLVALEGHPDYRYCDAVQAAISEVVTGMLLARKPAHELHFHVHARIGKPADEILHLAREVGADLVMVGSHDKTGLERVLLGSTSAAVVRGASCSVLVARHKRYQDVELLDVVPDNHPHHRYTPPHRYTYHNDIATRRPADWPLF